MSIQDDRKALIDEGVDRAFAAEGYALSDGRRDMTKVRERIFSVLAPRKVLASNVKEREEKAIPRGEMVAEVFPNLATPPAFEGAEDQVLAEAVWDRISAILWSEMAPNANKALQRLVGLNMGNGYILCRTKVNKGTTWATYITDNVQCIEQDFIRPDDAALERKIRALVANREMLIMRQPDNGDRWLKGFDRYLKAVGARAREQLALTFEATAGGSAASEDEGDDEA